MITEQTKIPQELKDEVPFLSLELGSTVAFSPSTGLIVHIAQEAKDQYHYCFHGIDKDDSTKIIYLGWTLANDASALLTTSFGELILHEDFIEIQVKSLDELLLHPDFLCCLADRRELLPEQKIALGKRIRHFQMLLGSCDEEDLVTPELSLASDDIDLVDLYEAVYTRYFLKPKKKVDTLAIAQRTADYYNGSKG